MPCVRLCDQAGRAVLPASLRVLALQEAKLYASGQSVVGPSPSTSLKRDRLMHRNAILRRTGFLEGTTMKGSIAGALSSSAHYQRRSCTPLVHAHIMSQTTTAGQMQHLCFCFHSVLPTDRTGLLLHRSIVRRLVCHLR